MKNVKIKKALAAGLSVALVAGLAVAGTVSYLQDTSEDAINTFSTNNVNVGLKETTGEDYNIIPGTSETKDPKVTVDNSVDAYVYVVVTDNTNGVVDYAIDLYDETTNPTGWKQLTITNDGETVTVDGVYYREVDANDTTKEFYVLKDNKVSYSADLTNEAMPDGPVTLTFTAYAIQRINGDSTEEGSDYSYFTPDEAYYQVRFGNSAVAVVDSADGLQEAISAGEVAVLNGDITIDTAIPHSETGTTSIDLNGNTLSTNSTILSTNLTVANGTFNSTATTGVSFALKSGGELTLSNVEFNTDGTINVEAGSDPSVVNIIDSTINSTDYYGVSTNAANNTTGSGVEINIVNSTVAVDNGTTDCTGILFNVPGTLNITNSTISGNRQGMIVRCGTANITDSTIIKTSDVKDVDVDAKFDYTTTKWADGNRVVACALTIGNYQTTAVTSYVADAIVNLNNVTLSAVGTEEPLVYLGSNLTYGAKLNVSDNSISQEQIGFSGSSCYFNGTQLTVTAD